MSSFSYRKKAKEEEEGKKVFWRVENRAVFIDRKRSRIVGSNLQLATQLNWTITPDPNGPGEKRTRNEARFLLLSFFLD